MCSFYDLELNAPVLISAAKHKTMLQSKFASTIIATNGSKWKILQCTGKIFLYAFVLNLK